MRVSWVLGFLTSDIPSSSNDKGSYFHRRLGYLIIVAVIFGDVTFEFDMDLVSVSSNTYSFLETELSA
jgi:hypothetical protein